LTNLKWEEHIIVLNLKRYLRKNYEQANTMIVKEKKWTRVIPEMEYRFVITLESDYPKEIFGAPKYYVMKAT